MEPGKDIRCVQENHTSAHIKEKTNHGYTAVNGNSTSKIQAANSESYVQLETL